MSLNKFERDSVSTILENEAPKLLRYLPDLEVSSREENGVGKVVNFIGMQSDNIRGRDLTLGTKLYADIGGMIHGVGFMLYVDCGVPTALEIFSHGNEIIPEPITTYKYSYI